MAVTSIKRLRRDTADQDVNGLRPLEIYQVVCDDDADTALTALSASIMSGPHVPLYGEAHDTVEGALVINKSVTRPDKAKNVYEVRVQYGPPDFGFGEVPPEGGGKWNKRVTVTGVEVVEGINRDRSKKPIKNSFGDVYPASIEKLWYDELVNVEFDTDVVDIDAISGCRGKINDDDITLTVTKNGRTYEKDFPAGTLKCGNASYEITIGPEGISAWHVVIPLISRSYKDNSGTEVGWRRLIADKGFRYKDGSDRTVKSEVEVFLDGTGHLLASGDDVVLLPVDIDEEADFSAMLSGV